MYSVQLCSNDCHTVIPIFITKELAIEYAEDLKRKHGIGQFPRIACAIEVLDGDKQILRLPLPFDM